MKRMATVFRLICVRHGETEANKEMRIQGHLDIPLSEIGKAQAREAGLYLSGIQFSRAFSSDLLRAKTTCENIIKESSYPLISINTDIRLRERNFGSVEGKLLKDVIELAKDTEFSWPSFNPPGAEALPDVQERVAKFFKELCQSVYDRSKNNGKIITEDTDEDLQDVEPSERILIVSHGAALRQLYIHFKKTLQCEGFSEGSDKDTKISPNTGISEFIVKYSPRKYRMKCVRLHEAKHLENLNSD